MSNDSHNYFSGEDWDELERKAAKCKANSVLQHSKSQLTVPIPQRTRNGQTVVAAVRATTPMAPIDQRKRHRRSPSHKPSLLMARVNAEYATQRQFLYRTSLLFLAFCLFCIRTIVFPCPCERWKDLFDFEKFLLCARTLQGWKKTWKSLSAAGVGARAKYEQGLNKN